MYNFIGPSYFSISEFSLDREKIACEKFQQILKPVGFFFGEIVSLISPLTRGEILCQKSVWDT